MSYGQPLVGFGGFGALSTGALAPEVETELQATLVAIDDLHNQLWADISTVSDQGIDTAEFQATAQAIATEQSVLWAEVAQADPSQAPELRQRIEALHAHAQQVQAQLAQLRRGAPERQQITGLVWGLGALAAAGAVAWFVWDQRKKRRRR